MNKTSTDANPPSSGSLSALRDIARALSGAWALDSTLDLIAEKTTAVTQVDSCSIYLLDSDSDLLRLQASTGLARQSFGHAVLRVGEGLTGYALQANCPIAAADAQNHPRFKTLDETMEAAYTSLLAIPLLIEERPIGAMNVQTIREHDFTADEIELVALIGDLAAGALAKAQLYDKQRRQIDELQALADVSELVTSPQYLDDILDVVTAMAARAMQTAVCLIFLLNEDSTHLELHSAKRNDPNHPLYMLPVNDGDMTAAVSSSSVAIAGWMAKNRLQTVMAVPLSVRDKVIGVLACYGEGKRPFSPEQHGLLTTLANQTALAIENGRLVTNAAVVREMHHRIKNNLQTVAMLMQMQLTDADPLNARDVLQTNIHRIRSIASVHEVLSERGFRLVDVKDVIQRISQAMATTMVQPKKSIQIRITGEPLQLPSKEATALTLVINELLQNSLEHAFTGRQAGMVEVLFSQSANAITVVVRDDGVGIADDYIPNLGLEIAETLVEDDLNGRLSFHHLDPGTEICIHLPPLQN